MTEGFGNVNVYNPDKQISEQITLANIVKHNHAMSLAMDGIPRDTEEIPKSPNERVSNMFKGIQEMISTQSTIIFAAAGVVETNNRNEWTSRNKSKEEEDIVSFDDIDNNFNELNAIIIFLEKWEQEIIDAKRTKKLDDDFIWERQGHDGELILELSPNFFKMRKKLCESYRVIHGILLREKILSNGVANDEDVKEVEKEEEMKKRILGA